MESQLQTIRHELKEWEHNFALHHDGRKATREEIKAEPTIAAKYKEYNALSGKAKTAQPHITERSPKRRRTLNDMTTPKKPRREQTIPMETVHTDEAIEELDATPTVQRAFVGPTPQKDGRVLGLFDALSPAVTVHAASPSKRIVMGPVDSNAVLATPSKRSRSLLDVDKTPINASKHSRTPQSIGKRFLLDKFITPSKRKQDADMGGHGSIALLGLTPQSRFKHTGMRTPAFLRRHSQAAQPTLEPLQEEDEHEDGATAAGMHISSKAGQKRRQIVTGRPGFRTSLGRSLSSMIADMRKAEDDHLDEEMELLRSLDDDTTSSRGIHTDVQSHTWEVDRQKLGPDGASDSEASEAESVGAPRKIWKKKGQKRQTRRVILKPVPRLPRPAAVEVMGDGLEDGDFVASLEDTAVDDVPGTSAVSEDVEATSPSKRRKTTIDLTSTSAKSGGLVEKVRKAGAQAHANYCRLKIRSSKGAAVGKPKGRFSRRR